jgi:N-acetylglucosaminyldiphosphoundecaprenol N-acetyl-beta-D-mannosaminyltransferase
VDPTNEQLTTENRPARGAVRILGLTFLTGSAHDAVERVSQTGGVLTVPAAPALVRLRHDPIYRQAMLSADYAIPDSGLMVLAWRILKMQNLTRVSGLTYLRELVRRPEFRDAGAAFFVLPSEEGRRKLLAWARANHIQIAEDDCYVAPHYALDLEDPALVERLKRQQPRHVIIAIGNGPQEKLGVYLRDHLGYGAAFHCIGAALGFLTGDQVAIPDWADRFYLGWLLRLFAQPRIFIPRLMRATAVPWMMLKWKEELPPLKRSRK